MRLLALAIALLLGGFACTGSSNNNPDSGSPVFFDATDNRDVGPIPDLGPAGGPVMGVQDMHCEARDHMDGGITVVDPAACAPPDAGIGADVGTSTTCPYGDTNYGTHALDDDCKYDVTYSVSPIFQNSDVTFLVTATRLADNTPVTGANVRAEIFISPDNDPCNATHPAPNPPPKTEEFSPGNYKISPVHFDRSARWTVRFHFYENCFDDQESPHGHVAFLVSVP
jgi:hypothetical protein